MRWTWPFNGRASDGEHKHGNRSHTADARPDFLCVGGQKAGTSWLYHQLTAHPDFWMPPVKELYYFDSLSRIKRRLPPRCKDSRDLLFMAKIEQLSARPGLDLEGYAKLFEFKGGLLSGDISPSYSTLNDDVVEDVISHFPNVNVIFLARDPVERSWSQLSMEARLQTIPSFDPSDPDEVARTLLCPGVLLHSHLSKIVARWRRYIRPDLFRIFFFDDLEKDPGTLRRSILSFLGADPKKPSGRLRADHKSNVGKDKPFLAAAVRSRMAQFFQEELKACAAELGGPAKHWPARYGFSLLLFFWDLVDDFELLFWCDWIS